MTRWTANFTNKIIGYLITVSEIISNDTRTCFYKSANLYMKDNSDLLFFIHVFSVRTYSKPRAFLHGGNYERIPSLFESSVGCCSLLWQISSEMLILKPSRTKLNISTIVMSRVGHTGWNYQTLVFLVSDLTWIFYENLYLCHPRSYDKPCRLMWGKRLGSREIDK